MLETEAPPIFIMSSERSGSNLLRTLLSNHSRIVGPVAPQFLPLFHDLVPYYGPLTEQENGLALIRDMTAVINHPYYNWDLPVDSVALYEQYHPQEFLDFFTLLYREKQRSLGKARFVCKENDIFEFAFPLCRYDSGSKFIYLYRDPRDYAASITKIPAGPKTAYSAALKWREEQEKCNVLRNTFGLSVHRVSYEALVADTAQTMTGLLRFLNEPVEEACFQVQTDKNEEVAWNVAWKNLSRPVMHSNYGKYRDRFDDATIRIIETVAREQMIRLNYHFDTDADWERPRFFRYRNFIASRINDLRVRQTNRDTAEKLASRNALVQKIRHKRKAEWRRRQFQ